VEKEIKSTNEKNLFLFSGVSSGIKKNSKKDFGIIALPQNSQTIGFFTTNKVKSEAIERAETILKKNRNPKIIAVISGNAMCRYEGVEKDIKEIVSAIKDEANKRKISESKIKDEDVILLATGKIGAKIDVDKVINSVPNAFENLTEKCEDFAEAILTTDKKVKISRYEHDRIFIVGIAKGAGMIFPEFSHATTLSFILTNTQAPKEVRKKIYFLLSKTIGAINIDFSRSTNDSSLFVFGNKEKSDEKTLLEGIGKVLSELAVKIVEDGEGVNHVVKIVVSGAENEKSARKICEIVSSSFLFKSSIAGENPDFGRVLAAVGSSGEKIGKINVFIEDNFYFFIDEKTRKKKSLAESRKPEKVQVVRNTKIISENLESARKIMKKDKYTIYIDIGVGKASSHILMTDLTEEYVEINKV
jgi:glutamate N-acetyltransferase/amino-acid N-acetyltransferase